MANRGGMPFVLPRVGIFSLVGHLTYKDNVNVGSR